MDWVDINNFVVLSRVGRPARWELEDLNRRAAKLVNIAIARPEMFQVALSLTSALRSNRCNRD